jgi:3-oxoacyl-(acyl-carrier-protein) synthase
LIPLRVRIAGTGIICAIGNGGEEVSRAIASDASGIAPLTRFKVPHDPPLPVGACPGLPADALPTPTIALARMAADQAMADFPHPPDAIVIGVTTGGMPLTENLLKQGCTRVDAFRLHGIGTVAEDLARRFDCRGPLITVSTACSSGGCAIALARAMILSGRYKRVLTGGADALCRLTYYGFKTLQLIDPACARPLDKDRCGMSVAEGAGMLLIEAAPEDFDGVAILGVGLSCDAHHPAQPHPEGRGALAAMAGALAQAGLAPGEIDYINLHGTGTVDNDRSETRAIHRLFQNDPPLLSSIKGATGHALAAAGAIEAVVAVHCIEHGLVPANVGCCQIDPDLEVAPVKSATCRRIDTVLSNSFGFGGNNAAVVIGRNRPPKSQPHAASGSPHPLSVIGWSAVTGAGFTDATLDALWAERECRGKLDTQALCRDLPPGVIRRIKRLSHIALALLTPLGSSQAPQGPRSVYFGTGWGSLSETNDFLKNLFGSDEKFSSPTDFIGSVHNAAAGQMALMAQATGTNLTLSGGDTSFEQALFSAQMLAQDDAPLLVAGADEHHEKLSPLFDPSVAGDGAGSDGGGALLLRRSPQPAGPTVELRHFATAGKEAPDIGQLISRLGGAERIASRYGLILAGIPAAHRAEGQAQLDRFLDLARFRGKVMDYRRLTGEYATASAVATVLAVSMVDAGRVPPPVTDSSDGKPKDTNGAKSGAVLVLGLGAALTAIEVKTP